EEALDVPPPSPPHAQLKARTRPAPAPEPAAQPPEEAADAGVAEEQSVIDAGPPVAPATRGAGRGLTWSVGAHVGARVPPPDVVSFEAQGCARVGPFELAVAFSPPARWNLSGVPVSLSSLGVSGGARFDLLGGD